MYVQKTKTKNKNAVCVCMWVCVLISKINNGESKRHADTLLVDTEWLLCYTCCQRTMTIETNIQIII